jgi:hypothetical protein
MDFEDLNWEKSYSPMSAYCRSKLANILFTKELATRTEGKSKIVCSFPQTDNIVVGAEHNRFFHKLEK